MAYVGLVLMYVGNGVVYVLDGGCDHKFEDANCFFVVLVCLLVECFYLYSCIDCFVVLARCLTRALSVVFALLLTVTYRC